jgi:hypothetical protein
MPKRSASILARIKNFGHDTRPAKKLQASNKENDCSQASSSRQPKSNMSCLPLPRPSLALANGQKSMPQPSIEEVEDDDREPAIDPLPFDADGPIIIEVLLSVAAGGSGLKMLVSMRLTMAGLEKRIKMTAGRRRMT